MFIRALFVGLAVFVFSSTHTAVASILVEWSIEPGPGPYVSIATASSTVLAGPELSNSNLTEIRDIAADGNQFVSRRVLADAAHKWLRFCPRRDRPFRFFLATFSLYRKFNSARGGSRNNSRDFLVRKGYTS